MKILVACEYSGTVRDAFIARGHDAMSCDLLDTETPGPHHKGDVLGILDGGWDLMVAHPPCTYLMIAGAANYLDDGRAERRDSAVGLFKALQSAPIPQIAIENPIPFLSVQEQIGKYDQYVNPFDFGVPIRNGLKISRFYSLQTR